MVKKQRNSQPKFQKPTDITQWWLAPHCGPGTTDTNEICGFCGENVVECARKYTEVCKNNPQVVETTEQAGCGGSGLWCSKCGRFWAQNSCGECFCGENPSADGAKLVLGDNGQVYCCCGQPLFRGCTEENLKA